VLRVEICDDNTAYELRISSDVPPYWRLATSQAEVGEFFLGVDAQGWRLLQAGIATVDELVRRRVAVAVPDIATVQTALTFATEAAVGVAD
jgi:hypothetical protein